MMAMKWQDRWENRALAATGILVSLLVAAFSLREASNVISTTALLFGLLATGLGAAVLHGVLWTIVDINCRWYFGSGGGSRMPTGWEAVLLSVTVTVPLIVVPPISQLLMRLFLDPQSAYFNIPARHYLAGIVVIACGAIGHLLLYGGPTFRFSGLKNLIFPIGAPPSRGVAIEMELIYACVHFSSIALVYQLVVHGIWLPTFAMLFHLVIFAFVWFFFVVVFILLFYPWSLDHSRGREFRGLVSGIVLMVSLTCAMLT
jgi:hypothetical protein